MTQEAVLDGRCHCGAVHLRVRLADGFATASRCDCSFCAMRGAVAVTAVKDGVEVLQGAESLRLYQFNTRVAEHWFCGTCGIYTHHRRRSNPDEFGVNAALFDGQGPFAQDVVPVHNGQVHDRDDPDAPSVAGHLHWRPMTRT